MPDGETLYVVDQLEKVQAELKAIAPMPMSRREGEKMRLPEILDDFNAQVHMGKALVLEEHIRILLRPKPRWLPKRVWRWLVGQMILIEETRHAS